MLQVERVGGVAGFGGSRSRIRSRGEVDTLALTAEDQLRIEGMFQSPQPPQPPRGPDQFRYKITRPTPAGAETVEVHEENLPAALLACVKDELV